jgi:CheY-like chemotaxis protein
MAATGLSQNLRILLVEDDSFVRHITSGVLNSIGFDKVLEAESGAEAIAVLSENEIDLLITDIQMENVNGLELVRQIRIGETEANKSLRVIAYTSFSFSEVLTSCLLLDVNGFLIKPVTPTNAKKKIRLAMLERLTLRSLDDYLKVKTDLDAIKINREQEQPQPKVNNRGKKQDQFAISGWRWVPFNLLQPGMELHEDLRANNGIKLLNKGQVLTENLTHRIIDLEDVIKGKGIRIKLN